jgi:hypothetical protein
MGRLRLITATLLVVCNASLAQVSTMGTTAVGIPSMPGVIVSSPLNGPSPFSAATEPGTLDTTLAPVPLVLNPTTPGTVVTCPPPIPSTLSASAALGRTIGTPLGSTTGTISPASPLGSSSTTGCSSTPGGLPTNGADLPLSTPEIPSGALLGTIQPAIVGLASTSIDPDLTVVPTPNSAACREGVTMNLSNSGTMAPASATRATATPGVSLPSGC